MGELPRSFSGNNSNQPMPAGMVYRIDTTNGAVTVSSIQWGRWYDKSVYFTEYRPKCKFQTFFIIETVANDRYKRYEAFSGYAPISVGCKLRSDLANA